MGYGRAYSIWHSVNSECYKSDKSFGGRGRGRTDQTIYVGTSASNSHELARIEVKGGHTDDDGNRKFNLFIDGELHKQLFIAVDSRPRIEVPISGDIIPVKEDEFVHQGYEEEASLTIGRLMKKLGQLVLGGRGDERVIVDLPKKAYSQGNGKATRPRLIMLEKDGKFVIQLQGISF